MEKNFHAQKKIEHLNHKIKLFQTKIKDSEARTEQVEKNFAEKHQGFIRLSQKNYLLQTQIKNKEYKLSIADKTRSNKLWNFIRF